MLAIELPDEIERRLKALAAHSGKSEADCAKEAILSFIEDAEDLQLALERLATPGRRWTLDEMEKRRDLEG